MEYTREYEWLRLREKFIKVDGVRNWKWKMWIGKKGEKTNEVRYIVQVALFWGEHVWHRIRWDNE